MKTYTLYLQNGKLKSENLFLLTDNYFLNGFERSFDEQFEGIVTQKGIFINRQKKPVRVLTANRPNAKE